MSWKNGDKGFLPVELISLIPSSVDGGVGRFVAIGCGVRYDIPPSQPSPVDVSQIKVGDEVTVKARVLEIDATSLPFRVAIISPETEDESTWIERGCVVSHTPSPPPSTLAEFKAMTPEQQERWFAEMTKGKAK